MVRLHLPIAALLLFTLLLALPAPARASLSDDYVKGYISALISLDPQLEDIKVEVTKGRAILTGFKDDESRARTVNKWKKIADLKNVKFLPETVPATKLQRTGNNNDKAGAENPGEVKFTRRLLFAPAIADPRSPRFSAAFNGYMGNNKLDNVASVSFGETLSLADIVRDGNVDHWEIDGNKFDFNFQGAVFSIFDLDGISKDLVNSDFWAALAVSWRRTTDLGDVSAMSRVFHQSSHLGDEYILFNGVGEEDRVNLSYEGIDLTGALEPKDMNGLKVYGGGGYLFGRDPASLDPWSFKIGMEKQWPNKVSWPGRAWGFYPVAAVHIQTFEETEFEPDLSIMGGMQFNDPVAENRQIRLLLSYFNGYSPNGQFYDEQLEYFGLGFQYQF
jgi:hypothetical protein